MNEERRAHYRQRLQEQFASLSEAVQDHRRQLDESHTTGDFVGGDRAAELESMEVDSSVAESEQLLAEKIRAALKRIENGTYGICQSCGEEIPAARLDAKPSVSLCVTCQEKHDAGEG